MLEVAVPEVRERPILMIAPMVCATLREVDPKTQTRREWPEQPPAGVPIGYTPDTKAGRYGGRGDRLWVKETFFAFGRWETRFSAKKGRDEWHFIDMTVDCGREYRYAATDTFTIGAIGRGGVTPMWWKRPAIFMPRVASRILLEVTDVRVERLNEISEADCWAEGIEEVMHDFDNLSQCQMAKRMGCCIDDAKPLYAQLWESINGPGSWDANPWVWAVSFRRLKP